MRSRIPHKGSDGHSTTNLALFMVTAPPLLYNGRRCPGFLGAPTQNRTANYGLQNRRYTI